MSSNTFSCLAVIPARLTSTRLPNKPLKDIGGKTLIERVYLQAQKAKTLKKVVVATDSPEIFNHMKTVGASVLMTSDSHLTGSDRVAEAAALLEKAGEYFDLIANVQGDMPFINPEIIDRTVRLLATSAASVGMSTVATPLLTEEEYLRPSSVKVVLGVGERVLYFSRAPIPYIREPKDLVISESSPYGYKHMGLYVFRPEVLQTLHKLEQSLPEQREKLEQLRALCNGVEMRVAIVTEEFVRNQVEVDTLEDLEKARAIAARGT